MATVGSSQIVARVRCEQPAWLVEWRRQGDLDRADRDSNEVVGHFDVVPDQSRVILDLLAEDQLHEDRGCER